MTALISSANAAVHFSLEALFFDLRPSGMEFAPGKTHLPSFYMFIPSALAFLRVVDERLVSNEKVPSTYSSLYALNTYSTSLIFRFVLACPVLLQRRSVKMTASPKYNFTTVPGFFKHDEEPTGPEFRAVGFSISRWQPEL